MAAGIIGYGAHIPRRRIKVEEIAKVWGADAPSYKKGLELREKSVPGLDEDTITLSVEAARNALARAQIDPAEIGAVYVGSESHPYAVKPSGTTVAEALKFAIEHGFHQVNLSTGNDVSKTRWGPQEVVYREALQISPSWRGRLSGTLYRTLSSIHLQPAVRALLGRRAKVA